MRQVFGTAQLVIKKSTELVKTKIHISLILCLLHTFQIEI